MTFPRPTSLPPSLPGGGEWNCGAIGQDPNGRPHPEGQRHRREFGDPPRGRHGAAEAPRRHHIDHPARPPARGIPGTVQ